MADLTVCGIAVPLESEPTALDNYYVNKGGIYLDLRLRARADGDRAAVWECMFEGMGIMVVRKLEGDIEQVAYAFERAVLEESMNRKKFLRWLLDHDDFGWLK